jgi:hypothetical protein
MIRVERETRTAIWNFGLQRGNFSISPWHWWRQGMETLFVEPQVAVTHDGCCA